MPLTTIHSRAYSHTKATVMPRHKWRWASKGQKCPTMAFPRFR